MISERLKTIASLVSQNDTVVDVGCDHGYLAIYLKKNNICKDVISSDINQNALNNAINNFKKYKLDIKTYLSDGFSNIESYYDTGVIAGVGAQTIMDIIKSEKTPNKLILASNNDLYKLRCYLNKIGYKIREEKVVYDNKHYYIVMLCIKGIQKLTKKELVLVIIKSIIII